MLAVPGATTVRGYSFFGDSFIYVIFEDGTDIYWARSRVLEYLSQVAPDLPAAARSQHWDRMPRGSAGSTSTPWWIVQRPPRPLRAQEPAGLVPEIRTADRSRCGGSGHGRRHGEAVPGGGGPESAAHLFAADLRGQARPAWRPTARRGGSVIEMGETEYMVRSRGYVQGEEDLRLVTPLSDRQDRYPDHAGGDRRGAYRAADAPRYRGTRRRRGSRGRHCRDASRRECPARPSRRCATKSSSYARSFPKAWRSSKSMTAPR